MRIGVLMDPPQRLGGAGANSWAFNEAAPASVELVPCPPDNVVEGLDAYIIHNCVMYSKWVIPKLQGKPVFKVIHDIWRDGDTALRAWLIDHATLIMVSPEMTKRHNWHGRYKAIHYIPSPIDIDKFTSENTSRNGRAIWVGRLHYKKGVANAIQWAQDNDYPLDIYGYGDTHIAGEFYRGEIANEKLPALLSDYSRFVFLPTAFDSCPRTTLEAYFAGCELIINDNCGSRYWLENDIPALRSATTDFWRVITDVKL